MRLFESSDWQTTPEWIDRSCREGWGVEQFALGSVCILIHLGNFYLWERTSGRLPSETTITSAVQLLVLVSMTHIWSRTQGPISISF